MAVHFLTLNPQHPQNIKTKNETILKIRTCNFAFLYFQKAMCSSVCNTCFFPPLKLLHFLRIKSKKILPLLHSAYFFGCRKKMSRYVNIDVNGKQFTILTEFMSQKLVSLEDALRPFNSEINDLERYIKEAKTKCTYPSPHGLTRDESASVYIYSMEWGSKSLYKMINTSLRETRSDSTRPWYSYLKLIITALLKLPIYHGNVWRGEKIKNVSSGH